MTTNDPMDELRMLLDLWDARCKANIQLMSSDEKKAYLAELKRELEMIEGMSVDERFFYYLKKVHEGY